MAAYRNGIRTVLLPADNEKDLEEIDQTVRAGLRFVAVEQVDAVLAEALAVELTPGNKELQHPLSDGTQQTERAGLTQ